MKHFLYWGALVVYLLGTIVGFIVCAENHIWFPAVVIVILAGYGFPFAKTLFLKMTDKWQKQKSE